jgi:hypothetical protein
MGPRKRYTSGVLMTHSRSLVLFLVAGLLLTVALNAQEHKVYSVTICVADQTGAPIPNAQVRLIPAPVSAPAKMQTDLRGELSVQLEEGGHALFVTSQGFVPDVQHIEIKRASELQRRYSILRIGTNSGPIVVAETPAVPHVLLSASPYHEPLFITLSDLSAMPHTTVVIRSPSTHKEETYSGVRISDLFMRIGAPLGKELYGVALRTYVVATGRNPGMGDSVDVAFALAEFDTSSKCGAFILADTLNGHPIESDLGPFMLISESDALRIRWVHNLQSLIFHP